MRTATILFLLFFPMATCRNPIVEKPVWLNKTNVLHVPGPALRFSSHSGNWQVSLLSFTQPFSLAGQPQATGFSVALDGLEGIAEGPAQLCLSLGEHHFYYPVDLRNKAQAAIINKDYRSPKTVNPDSSLVQQRLVHVIDSHRNLINLPGRTGYFLEEDRLLSPRVATYRAIKNEALSSYYVQPGSCTTIPLKASYRPEIKCYSVSAGPLFDRFNNKVADGTLVDFVYRTDIETNHMQASLLNGYSTIRIPASNGERYRVQAKIHQTVSKPIDLHP